MERQQQGETASATRGVVLQQQDDGAAAAGRYSNRRREAVTRELSWVQAVSSGAAFREWIRRIVGASNRAEIGENEMRILIDLGSNENCVPMQFPPALRATLYPSRRVLLDVQGRRMQVQGSKKLAIQLVHLDPEEDRVHIVSDFISCSVRLIVFSLEKLIKGGVHFEIRQGCLAASVARHSAKIIIQDDLIYFVAEQIDGYDFNFHYHYYEARAWTSGVPHPADDELEEAVISPAAAAAEEEEGPREGVQVKPDEEPRKSSPDAYQRAKSRWQQQK